MDIRARAVSEDGNAAAQIRALDEMCSTDQAATSGECADSDADRLVGSAAPQAKQSELIVDIPSPGGVNELPSRMSLPILQVGSTVFSCQLNNPLGCVLEEDDQSGAVLVLEIIGDGNAANAGIAVGDMIRAVSACKSIMTYPPGNLLLGGIGRPGVKKQMIPLSTGTIDIDDVPVVSGNLDTAVGAIASCRKANQPVVLVLERFPDEPK